MWKETKQKEQLAELFLQSVNLKDDFMREYNSTHSYVKTAYIMEAMGVLPDGMKVVDSYNIQDFAGNNIMLYFMQSNWQCGNERCKALEYLMIFDIYQTEKSNRVKQNYCVTFLEQAQAVAPYIRGVQNREGNSYYDYSNVRTIDVGTAKPNDIHQFCKSCSSDKNCLLVLYFKL